ncbi:hypothetical protein NNC19_19300 [Clostridium sp. SHJSY1]|nr:hypothetical protein [Clostridium sp. SHJSY1]
MNKSKLERLYEERGLMDYKLKTLQDLFFIYGVKLNQVDGYSKLEGEYRVRVKEFIMDYYNSYGLESSGISILNVIKTDEYLKVELVDDGHWRIGFLELGVNN